MGFYLKKRLHKNYFIQTRTSILYSQIQFLIIINLDILCIDNTDSKSSCIAYLEK